MKQIKAFIWLMSILLTATSNANQNLSELPFCSSQMEVGSKCRTQKGIVFSLLEKNDSQKIFVDESTGLRISEGQKRGQKVLPFTQALAHCADLEMSLPTTVQLKELSDHGYFELVEQNKGTSRCNWAIENQKVMRFGILPIHVAAAQCSLKEQVWATGFPVMDWIQFNCIR